MTEEVNISGRQQRRLEKEQEQAAETKKNINWVQIRMFPIWLRILLCIVLFTGAAAAGLMVGYGVLGNGTPKDALKWETYQHILDIKDGNNIGGHFMLTTEQVQALLPHRYPFLMIDRILELEEGKRAVGLKNVTINEAIF